jgi:hypothetical protein
MGTVHHTQGSTAMTLRSILTRTATIALATAALAAPAASARPADNPPAVAKATANAFPTRPVIDRSPAKPQSDAAPQAPADRGTDWTTIAIGIAGSLLAVGAITAIAGRTRRSGRARITA